MDPNVGYLTIESKPPARIEIDGNDTGKTTPITGRALPLPPGKHTVTFVMSQDTRIRYFVVIQAGATFNLVKDLR